MALKMTNRKIHPQTYAKEIAKNIQTIGNNACCAFTTMWAVGVIPDDNAEWIKIVSDAINSKVLKPNCTVIWADFIKWLTGRNIKVTFKKIDTIKDIIKPTPVLYRNEFTGFEHWVGVENGKIAFNSLEKSYTVENGHPIECRIIELV